MLQPKGCSILLFKSSGLPSIFLDFLLMTDNQIRKLSNPVFNESSFISLTAFLRKYDCLIPPLMFQKNYAKLNKGLNFKE